MAVEHGNYRKRVVVFLPRNAILKVVILELVPDAFDRLSARLRLHLLVDRMNVEEFQRSR